MYAIRNEKPPRKTQNNCHMHDIYTGKYIAVFLFLGTTKAKFALSGGLGIRMPKKKTTTLLSLGLTATNAALSARVGMAALCEGKEKKKSNHFPKRNAPICLTIGTERGGLPSDDAKVATVLM